MIELPATRTPIHYQGDDGIINAVIRALTEMDHSWSFTRRSIRLCAAQIGVESGLTSCMNFNLSGMKTSPNNKGGYSWQYFKTRERFDNATYARAKALGPIQDIGIDACLHNLYLLPKHPWCCFRAFDSLEDAMRDHIATLQRKFPLGLAGMLAGDAHQFAHGLKQNGYYTATEKDYEQGLGWRYAQELKAVPDTDIVWGEIEP